MAKELSDEQPIRARADATDELPGPEEYLRDGFPTERLVGQFMTGLGMGLGFRDAPPLSCEAIYVIGAVAALGPVDYDSLRQLVWKNVRAVSALHTFDSVFAELRQQRWFAKNRRGAFVLSKAGRLRLFSTSRNLTADLHLYESRKAEATKRSRTKRERPER